MSASDDNKKGDEYLGSGRVDADKDAKMVGNVKGQEAVKIEGEELEKAKKNGEFVRQPTTFRNWIRADGEFPPVADRYHLYLAKACPWCHRVEIMVSLLGLEKVLPMTFVDSHMDIANKGSWAFHEDRPDPVNGFDTIKELYHSVKSDYDGRYTVPILYDTKEKTIVSNESADLIVMINREFAGKGTVSSPIDYNPEALKEQMEEVNSFVYPQINNGVYRTGFARSQTAYEDAFRTLFDGLDRAEKHLEGKTWLLGSDQPTLADIRLFVTLARFDDVYFVHFKCNGRMIRQYKNLGAFVRRMMAIPEIARTIDMKEYKTHYYWSHESINPNRIIPLGLLDPLVPDSK